jgi:RNA polymerase sigma-70 factor (ECF subfamily)
VRILSLSSSPVDMYLRSDPGGAAPPRRTVRSPSRRPDDVVDSASSARADDASLLDAMRQGDERAAATLYDRHSPIVFGLALSIVQDRSDAESVLLDVFAQAWRDAARYDATRGSVASWLLVLARSRALDHVRSKGRRARLTPLSVDDAPPSALIASDVPSDPSLAVEASDRHDQVAAALSELPDAQRAAIELAFFEGLSHSEIAEQLREPLGTVKTRIRLGMTKLRQLLQHFEREVVL